MTQRETALQHAANGWRVFPCRSVREPKIDKKTGELVTDANGEDVYLEPKTPLTSTGCKAATRMERIINRWWSDWPDALVGVATGEESGIMVIDIDNKPGGANGFEWLSEMEDLHGPLPETLRVKTPMNGGLHIYFRYVEGARNRGNMGAGTDARGEGGYVIGAGSTFPDGTSYEAIDPEAPIADAPQWLIDLLVKKHEPRSENYEPYSGTNDKYVNAAIDSELRELAQAPNGTRNNALNDSSFALGQFVGAGAISRGEAESALEGVAAQWDNFPKSKGTIRNGLAAGERNPREIPAPQEHQDNTRLIDISRMIKNGLAKARGREFAEGDEPEEEEKEEESKERAPIVATPYEWLDPAKIPRREFAYGTHLIRKYVSVTVAPGGVGKTNLIIAESLAMATGRMILGVKPPKPLRVWLFNAEDPRDELTRRIAATCIHHKISPEDIGGRLFLDTGREQELVVAVDDKKSGLKYLEPIIEAVISEIKRNEIDVMIIDPFVSTHGVNENDNGAIDKVAKLWALIADETNCAIDIVHHLRKVSDREATVEDSRGAVSLLGAARSVRVLNRMSASQAGEAGVDPKERFGYFSVNEGKSNLTPMSDNMDWRRMVSTPLGNGRGIGRPQDFAPAVEEFKWPTKEDIANSVPSDKASLVVTRVANGNYAYGWQSKEWVGHIVADITGIEIPEGRTKTPEHKKIEKMIDGWIDSGALKKVRERGQDVRHPDREVYMVRVG